MNWKRFFVFVFAILVALSLGSTRLAAQTQSTGDVAGVVTDPSNSVVPDARVNLKDNAKGNSQDTKSNRDGSYRFYLLPPGTYTVTVSASGFQNTARVVEVAVGQIANINIQLTLGLTTQTVTVTESAPLMSTDNGNVAATLSQSQIANVPNPGNDMSYIAQLAPGTVMNTGAGFGNFSSYGTPGTSNLFTLNGMDDNDPFLNLNNSGATNLLLGANEVQEATVVTGGYSGEYGTLAGASVNYITKSGGNEFHGNAAYYWNGRAMNANDWFNKAGGGDRSFDNVNQWGAGFGGPIKKDKLFFFFNTEGLRVVLPTSVQATIPSPQFESAIADPVSGQLAQNGLQASIPFFNQMFNLYNTAKGAANAKDTLAPGVASDGSATGDGCGDFTFTNGAPCALTFRSQNGNFTHEYTVSGRVDYNVGSKDKTFLRVGYDHGLQATFTDVINPVFNLASDQPQWQGQLMETHTFSSTTVNQLIVSGAWYGAVFVEPNRAAALAAFPTTVSWRDGAFSRVGNELDNSPQGRNVTQYQISDDLSKTIGNHTVKVGVKFRRNDVTDFDNGILTAGFLGITRDTAAVGQVQFFEQSFPTTPAGTIGALETPAALYSLAFYGEDDWRIKSNLTLTFALRAEHFSNPVCQSNCFARLTGPFANVSHDPAQPYKEAINTGLHSALQGLQSIAWGPRFGFAWQPFGSARNLVVRGGAGLFYDQFPGQVVDNFSQNPPLYNIFVVGGCASPAETNPSCGGPAFSNASQSNQAFVNVFNTNGTVGDLTAAGFSPPNIFTANKQTKIPQYQKWSLEVQKGFGANTTVQVGYYGNHGIHELIEDPSLNAFCGAAFCSGFGLPDAPPDQRFGTVSFADTHSVSNYNGVTAAFNHRIHGWGSGVFSASYTYSHGFDEVSNGGLLPFIFSTNTSPLTPQIPGDYRNNYGPSDYDVRHYASANYVWQLPVRRALFGHGWAPLVDGWQVSGAIFARSGLPYTVTDPVVSGELAGSNYGGTVYPQFLGGSIPGCGRAAALTTVGVGSFTCLTADQFDGGAANPASAFGSNGLRNKFRGPGYTDTDFTVSKSTKIPGWERGELALGFQFFNAFNHPNFDQPINDKANPQFGQIVSAVSTPTSILGAFLGGDAAPRLIQLKLELKF